MTDDGEKLEQIGHAMMLAWGRIKKAQARMWGDWMTIGEGLLEGRRWAMQRAGTNRPEGKGYVMAYAEWLKRYRVDDLDKSDRAKLLQLMEDRPGVEEWRATLTDYERRNLNNPTIAWRKWTAATRVKKPKPRTAGTSATEHGRALATLDERQSRIEELEEELAAAQERIRELEAALAAVCGQEDIEPAQAAPEPVAAPQPVKSAATVTRGKDSHWSMLVISEQRPTPDVLDQIMRPWLADPPWVNKQIRLQGYCLGGDYGGWLQAAPGADAIVAKRQPPSSPEQAFQRDGVDAVRLRELITAEWCWKRWGILVKDRPRQRKPDYYSAPRCHVLVPQSFITDAEYWRNYDPEKDRPDGRWLNINTGSADDNRIGEILALLPADTWIAVIDYWQQSAITFVHHG